MNKVLVLIMLAALAVHVTAGGSTGRQPVKVPRAPEKPAHDNNRPEPPHNNETLHNETEHNRTQPVYNNETHHNDSRQGDGRDSHNHDAHLSGNETNHHQRNETLPENATRPDAGANNTNHTSGKHKKHRHHLQVRRDEDASDTGASEHSADNESSNEPPRHPDRHGPREDGESEPPSNEDSESGAPPRGPKGKRFRPHGRGFSNLAARFNSWFA